MTLNNIILRSVFFAAFGLLASCNGESASVEVPTPPIWQNPHLADNNFSGVHFNAYQTDTTSEVGPASFENQRVDSGVIGPIPFGIAATITFDNERRLITLWSGAEVETSGVSVMPITGRKLLLMDPETLEIIDEQELPSSSGGGGTGFGSGAYFDLDKLGRAILPTTTTEIRIYSVFDNNTLGNIRDDEFVLDRTIDLSGPLSKSTITSIIPDRDGNIWFITEDGKVGYVDPDTFQPADNAKFVDLRDLPEGSKEEGITNSVATDEDGGVYVNSNHALYRFEEGAGASDPIVVWKTTYDRGSPPNKPGQVDVGSGTTPTLFNDFAGNKFVVITDNADPFMHVNVYNRETGELVAQQAVFGAGEGANENSLIAVNHSIVVENNYGYNTNTEEGVNSTLGPKTTVGGQTRVDFDPETGDSWVVWEKPTVIPSVVSQLSTSDGYIYTYTKKTTGWFFTAIDFMTGDTIAETQVFPDDPLGISANNNYAGIGILDGDAYLAVFHGIVAWRGEGQGPL